MMYSNNCWRHVYSTVDVFVNTVIAVKIDAAIYLINVVSEHVNGKPVPMSYHLKLLKWYVEYLLLFHEVLTLKCILLTNLLSTKRCFANKAREDWLSILTCKYHISAWNKTYPLYILIRPNQYINNPHFRLLDSLT